MEITLVSIGSAFLAGLIMFLAPCTLPLVPAYLGFISGVDTAKLQDPERAPEIRKKIFLNGLLFIIGFSGIFILFGVLAGLAGQALVPWRLWLTRAAGIFVILFGISMLGVFRLPIFKGANITLPDWLSYGNPITSLIVGAAFAFGWTPCVGPILASILLLAGSSATAGSGALLLAVFSLGMAIPFLFVAAAYSYATKFIERISHYLRYVEIIGGVFLILLGGLLVTDNFDLTIQYGYWLLDVINYEELTKWL